MSLLRLFFFLGSFPAFFFSNLIGKIIETPFKSPLSFLLSEVMTNLPGSALNLFDKNSSHPVE